MAESPFVLVVCATARECASPQGWRTLVCGVGPVESAAATAAEIARLRPSAILHLGIAGARRASGIAPTSLIIGTASRYCDLGVTADWAPNTVDTAPALIAAAQHVLPAARSLVIGTSARIGGGIGCDVEAMEGFGVLRAAQHAGVPAIEVRAISNEVEESDRAHWHFDDAFAAITNSTPALVAALMRAVAGGDHA